MKTEHKIKRTKRNEIVFGECVLIFIFRFSSISTIEVSSLELIRMSGKANTISYISVTSANKKTIQNEEKEKEKSSDFETTSTTTTKNEKTNESREENEREIQCGAIRISKNIDDERWDKK